MDISEKERRAAIVAFDYDGIVPTIEAFYILSILYSAKRCLDAFDRYDALDKKEENAEELVCIVQEAVGHAAALSRYFWPSPKDKKNQPTLKHLTNKRGEKLRKAFQIDKDSPLFNRALRNAWEHFDERLDEYFLENDAGYFFPSCLLNTHALADDPTGHVFKLLDINEECLVLMGKKFFFAPIRTDVLRVKHKAKDFDSNGSRLSFNEGRL
ncbi:hypothetical protein [Thiorhodovibrio frisius]|uniref:Uncharacterized protein n=1 Tax=Thiorhodovibrio frisius TaxID=631362 RepID=H8Z461_9GAMM|nr:hypothetical protein [Thiorhodovibrio frisius]EIC21147.1 hypothetical protein Thi970DRAFT_04837 [Thiorhodovibrio frisius]WPL22208.1 hypothetical protein Thiofri_02368 [Thiorhodovibrio frisius]